MKLHRILSLAEEEAVLETRLSDQQLEQTGINEKLCTVLVQSYLLSDRTLQNKKKKKEKKYNRCNFG